MVEFFSLEFEIEPKKNKNGRAKKLDKDGSYFKKKNILRIFVQFRGTFVPTRFFQFNFLWK